jgi:hypothetical protein
MPAAIFLALILSHEIRCGATAWLRLEVDMRRSKVVSVADYLAVARWNGNAGYLSTGWKQAIHW